MRYETKVKVKVIETDKIKVVSLQNVEIILSALLLNSH